MKEKKIAIIGAGIAGLSAGCYACMNGYHAEIFESHKTPGGLCTSWKRKGYTFDGCIHWLIGSGENTSYRKVWDELGALDGKTIMHREEFMRVVDESGKNFILYTDPDVLEKHMLELSLQDEGVIRELTSAIRRSAKLDMSTGAPESIGDMLQYFKMLPNMPDILGLLRKYSRLSIQEFSSRFKDPFLQKAFLSSFNMPDFPMIAVLMSLGSMAAKNAGYPIGGSLEFARAIEKRFLDLGGIIHYESRVEKILVENNKAVGVRLADGSEHQADEVISAADGHTTLFGMLEGKYLTDELRKMYDDAPIFPSLIQVSLGVNHDLSDQPQTVQYFLETPISIAGEESKIFGMKHYSFDPTLAPQGKSCIVVTFIGDYDYWKKLAEDPERYEAEKKDIGLKVIRQLEKFYPGIESQIEVVDIATPITYERFTGNWKGSMEGWLIGTYNIDKMLSGKTIGKTLPGLDAFYQIGQWVEPGGGIPPAASSGRGAIRQICKKDGKKFITSRPATQ